MRSALRAAPVAVPLLLFSQFVACAVQEDSLGERSSLAQGGSASTGGTKPIPLGGTNSSGGQAGSPAKGGTSGGGAAGNTEGGSAGGGCTADEECDDLDSCTADSCEGGGCVYVDEESCGTGMPFTINSFNSFADWSSRLTTPDRRSIVDAGMNANLEGEQNLYVADSDGASLQMAVASMVGLTSVVIAMQSVQAGTESEIQVGVFDGTSWVDLPLADYGQVSQGSYSTISVPLLDFGVPLGTITDIRIVFAPGGSPHEWRIDDVAATN